MPKRFTQSLPLLGTLCLLIIGSAVLFKLTPAGAIIAITAEAETLPEDAADIEPGSADNTEEISEGAATGITEDTEGITETTATFELTNTMTVSATDRVKDQVISKVETVQNDSFLQTNGLVILGALIAIGIVITMMLISARRSHPNR